MGFLSIGLKLLPYVITAVESVEKFISGRSGPDKEALAVSMVDHLLKTVEVGSDKDLLNDDAVNAATRDVIRAVVSLQNVIRSRGGQSEGDDV